MINKMETFEYAVGLLKILNQDGQNVIGLILGDYSMFGENKLYFLDFDISYKCGYSENIVNQCKDFESLNDLGELLSNKLNIPFKKELINQ